MSNIPQNMQNLLDENFHILDLNEQDKKISADGTVKYLFKLLDGNCIESVILKDENGRYTFCISTQVGCKFNCSFCMTGKMAFIRDLTYSEIISQILFLANAIEKNFNIVFMGMGEPLDNFDNLVSSIKIICHKNGFNFSISRVTVSTNGIIDKIPELFKIFPKINLAVSINSFLQGKREKIMPIAKKFLLNDLINILLVCYKKYKNRITLEYVLINNFNDNIEEIEEIKKLKRDPFLINIIPLNIDDSINNNEKLDESKIKWFSEELNKAGFLVTRRYRRGEDIQASCGLLCWQNKKVM